MLAAVKTRAVQLRRVDERRQSLSVSTIQATSDRFAAVNVMTSRLLQLQLVHCHINRITQRVSEGLENGRVLKCDRSGPG